MPIYEYQCEGCSHDFELLLRNGDSPGCPQCGSTRLTRRLSIPAAHSSDSSLPIAGPSLPPPCGMGGCGRPECE